MADSEYISFAQFAVCCGADTIQSIYGTKPERVLEKYVQTQVIKQVYNSYTKTYTSGSWSLQVAFVLFGGPNMKQDNKVAPYYLAYDGPHKLAAYLRENNLGKVLETSHRYNPRHTERKPGEADLVIYIWEVDEDAFRKWYYDRNPDPNTGVIQAAPTKIEPPQKVKNG